MPDRVRTERLTVTYPGAEAPQLRNVSFAVGVNERVLLLGPSGAGKSTLLRTLAGVVPQTIDADVAGEVTVCGMDPRSTPVPQLAARVATLSQDPAYQLCLPTVADEVAFALENRAVPAAQIAPRVRAALGAVGAEHLGGRRTSELSGGEGQRVALAAALVAGPELMLLDEPTALLDPVSAGAVGELLAGLGGASVLIEHRLDELGTLPERTVVLGRSGAVIANGPTEQVLTSPAVAGTGSWLPATAEVARALGAAVSRGQLGAALGEVAERVRRPGAAAGGGVRAGGADFRVGSAGAGSGGLTDGAVRRSGTGGAGRATGPVLLTAREAQVRRGERAVLTGVNLELRAGQITAVLGVNGAGKSSLLLALAGLLETSGVHSRARVGMVFQNPEHQFLTRTVADEIAYGLPGGSGGRWARRGGLAAGSHGGRPDQAAVVARTLERYHLTGRAGQDPFRLSGGQQRRLSLAAMAVTEDEVLLADEPTFGQDRHTTTAVAGELRRLADAGRAIVLTTHDLRLAAELADQVLLLAGGRPVAAGPTDGLLVPGLLARAGLRLPPLLAAWPGPITAIRPVLDLLRAEPEGARA